MAEMDGQTDLESEKMLVNGGYGLGNLGDDALMVAFLNSLTAISNREIGITYSGNADTYLSRMVPDVRLIQREAAFNYPATYYIYGGGTIWHSFPGRSFIETSKRILKNQLILIQETLKKRSSQTSIKRRFFAAGVGPAKAQN